MNGEFELYLPQDWVDLLADGPCGPDADAEAEVRFAELLANAFPLMDQAMRDAGVEGLLAWRRAMLDAGLVSHGVVNCPRDAEGDVAEAARRLIASGDPSAWSTWHVLTSVVDVPAAPAELDLGEFIVRVLGQRMDLEACYLESFSTEMGCGIGLIVQPPISGAADAASALLPGLDRRDTGSTHYGLAAALTTGAGGGPGLLVAGMCVDPEQVLELAALVAMIAGNSRVSV